jgi:hypothetical protein
MRRLLVAVAALAGLAAAVPVFANGARETKDIHFVPPDDAGVLNVRDYGVVGDGKTDDTAAINKIIREMFGAEREPSEFLGGRTFSRYRTPPFIYFPDGTYLVSGPIESKRSDHGWSGGWMAGLLLVGESRDGTIIKLADNADGYGDAETSKPVIITGSESDKRTKPGDKPISGGGNRAFRHSVINLTVDVGNGNPGATAIDYVASNRGTIERVTVKAGENSGHTGLKMTRNWPGPALLKDFRVEGFDIGIDTRHYQYSMTFEDIELIGQRSFGVRNDNNAYFFHRLTSRNEVPVISSTGSNSQIVVVDGLFEGGASDAAAVIGAGHFYLRDVKVDGYGKGVEATGKVGEDAPSGSIDFYVTRSFTLGGAEAKPMRLEIADSTTMFDIIAEVPTSEWVNVQDHGAMPGGEDDTSGIQAALDTGAAVVYLPVGSYSVTGEIVVPETTRLLLGMQSAIGVNKANRESGDLAQLRIPGDGESFTVEHIAFGAVGLIQDGERSVSFRHIDAGTAGGAGKHGQGYTNTERGSGDVHFDDTIGPKPVVVRHPQRLFARQLNIEFGQDPLVRNYGGDLWLFGYKTEGSMPALRQDGGRTELLGGLLYPLKNGPAVPGPAIDIRGGTASLSYVENGRGYSLHVKSPDGNITRKELQNRGATFIVVDAE